MAVRLTRVVDRQIVDKVSTHSPADLKFLDDPQADQVDSSEVKEE